ncbi:MAG TPA: response regulator [Stellaceae bacterium]|nr:response regulator [Stellaceae bacterium]
MKRILIVEDDPSVRAIFELVLGSRRYLVDAVSTATDAGLLLDLHPYDLVVADWNLPDGSGVQVADRATAAGVKALIVSGFRISARNDNASRHEVLTKPIRPAELLTLIESRIGAADPDS